MLRLLASALLLISIPLVTSGCGGLAKDMMADRIEKNLRADPPTELPDGLHVLICGAGGPMYDAKRSGPCVAIIAGETVIVVDSGSGAARNLGRMGLPPAQVEAVFLTHFHSDHIDGLGELGALRWVGDAWTAPLPVHGPSGVEQLVEGFNLAYAQDQEYRTAHHGEKVAPTAGRGLSAQLFSVPAEHGNAVVFEKNGLTVRAFAVDHTPVSPAVGYRFDYMGRSVVVSGDTSKSENLIAQSKDVDVLVHEALSRQLVGVLNQGARQAGAANVVKITDDITNYHASPVEAAKSAEQAGARYLLFYHVVPPLPFSTLEGIYLEGVSKAYSGRFQIAVDGTFISLPAALPDIDVDER
jgi:ribonuclease Z